MSALRGKIAVNQDNFCVEYTLDAAENVNAFSNGMLTHNEIGGILGYIYDAGSGSRRLRFGQPGGTQLSLLMGQALKKEVILSILGNIADTIRRANEYMLDESGFLFDSELIFVNTATLKVELIYIPTGVQYGCPFWEFVRNMLVSVIVSTAEDMTYVQKILYFINANQPVSSAKLGDFIKSVAAGRSTESAPFAAPQVNFVPSAAPMSEPVPAMTAARAPAPAQMPPQTPGARTAPPQTPVAPVENKPQKAGLFSGLKGKKKNEKPPKAEKNPVPASGGFGFNIPGQNPAAAAVPVPPPPPSARQGGIAVNHGNPPPAAAPQQGPAPIYAAPAPEVEFDEEPYDGRTVLLDANSKESAGQERAYFLEGKNNGRVFINKSMFFVGKADNSDIPNDFIIKNNAVSRNHAYFQTNAGGVSITDNNSSNGTFVNDERIPGLVRRELKDGDVIKFANEIFVFRIQ